MKSISILLLFSLLGFNTCQSKIVMQGNDSVIYSLCIDFIKSIDFDINNNARIKLNCKGLQEIQSVNFQKYDYFMIDFCSFQALILPDITDIRPQTPIVCRKGNTIIIHSGSIFLDIGHLKEEEVKKYKQELLILCPKLK
jgi:hypothetical protein